MKTMKAVIYAGGLALRLINSFGKLNKHLLPLGNRAVIEFGIDQLRAAGVTEILILTNKGWKAAIKFLFAKTPKPPFIEVWASPPPPVQLADLLLEAEDFVGKESFLLLLGDNFFPKAPLALINKIMDVRSVTNKIILARAETCLRFGVPIFEEGKIRSIVEKPKKIESGLVVTGLAKYGPEVFDLARSLIRERQNTRALTDVGKRGAIYKALTEREVNVKILIVNPACQVAEEKAKSDFDVSGEYEKGLKIFMKSFLKWKSIYDSLRPGEALQNAAVPVKC